MFRPQQAGVGSEDLLAKHYGQRNQVLAATHQGQVVTLLKQFEPLVGKQLDFYLQLQRQDHQRLLRVAEAMREGLSREVRELDPQRREGLRERVKEAGRRNKLILGKVLGILSRVEQIAVGAGRAEKRQEKEVEYYRKMSEVKFKLGEARARLQSLREQRSKGRPRPQEENLPTQVLRTFHRSIDFLKRHSQLDREDFELVRRLQ